MGKWLNINNLDKYDFLTKIGIRKDYCRRTGEWSYWNWEIWERLKFVSKIIDSSVGKNWEDVWKHILEKVPKKHHHLLIDCEFKYKPDLAFEDNDILYEQNSYGRILEAWKGNLYINQDGILFIAYKGREHKRWKNKKEKTKIKNPENVPYIDKLIQSWSYNAEYVYFPIKYKYDIYNSKVRNDYDYYVPRGLSGNINRYTWKYINKEGEIDSITNTFNNMIRWFEKHNKSYLILHKGHLFYSENFNKTMMK